MNPRPARPDDVDRIVALVREAYQQYVPAIGREPAPMTADYRAVLGHCWVLEIDGQLAGVLVLVPYPDHLLLENVAVGPRGRGIGSALLGFAEDRARELGLDEIRLYTNEAMTGNLAFYPRRGYSETHRTSRDGFRRVWFSKSIPSAGSLGTVEKY